LENGRWNRIEDLFHQATVLAAADRHEFIDRACGDDEELRCELESLLAADTSEPRLIRAAVAHAVEFLPAASEEGSELIGKRIGCYSITGLIGKGGMGAVYRALREDDFLMQVAIKVLKRGTDTEAAVNRFCVERQILAGLQHPNIARLLDGGTTDTGLPYFVMEHVDGKPLLEYVAPLSLPQRLELFRAVCSAVLYAHQKLVVHRDIKPANILVTPEGIPKLLDFGIAKLMNPAPDCAATTGTTAGVRLMTPDYASPEQLRGQKVTTATDVYSLGVVLYELLTGERFHPNNPQKPSTGTRNLDPDLNNIVHMALCDEPEKRYASVDRLSDDLGRFLQDLPVHASKEGLPYRGRKFRKRHRLITITAALIAVVVVALVVGLHQSDKFSGDANVRSIAVLPLENLSSDREQEYFADGLTDALISDLSRTRALRVISRTSAMSYKGVHRPIPEIARGLGVQTIVEGSVLRSGNRLRISVRLVDAPQDRPVWSGVYEGEPRDLLVLQERLVEAIAGEIHVALTAPDQARVDRNQRVNLDAYDAYLKGRYALFRASVADVQRSIQLFENALEMDPRYAPAYAGLADSYLSLSGMYLWPDEAMKKAKAAATRALEIDPDLAEAHVSMGVVRGWYEFDWDKSEREFKRAIELNPNDASARLWYGSGLASTGRSHDGISQVQIAHELDPLSAFVETGLGQLYFLSGQYQSAIRQLRGIVESDPGFVHGHMFLGVAYLYTKQYREAVHELENAMQLDPREPQSIAYLAYAHAKLHERQAAAQYLQQLKELNQTRYVSGYLFAVVSLGMETNIAVDWLQKAYEQRDDMLAWLKVDAIFDPLRADTRFKVLLRQIGFDSGTR
jgi:serine/threonine protein kinase/tetratricopeptide (TPR) repeat protein